MQDKTSFGGEQNLRRNPSFSQYYADRVVFISGAAGGIGTELVKSLYACGARLAIADIDGDDLRNLVTVLAGDQERVMTFVFDVRNRTAFDDCFRLVVERWGKLDFVFNNAGILIFGDTLEFTADDWDNLVDVNIKGTINGTMSAIRQMKPQGYGKIVNMASITGLVPFPGVSGYTATKHAIVGFTKSIEVECEDLGICFCTVCPGLIRTPLTSGGKHGAVRGKDVDEHLKRVERAGPMDVDIFADFVLRAVAKEKTLIIVPRRYKLWAFFVRSFGDQIGRWLVRKLYRMTYNPVESRNH